MSRQEELKSMERDDLREVAKALKEKGKELPPKWNNLKNDELVDVILELEGVEQVEEKTKVEESTKDKKAETKITLQNPFGEEIIETVIPVDQLNPSIKAVQITVNFEPLMFPVGKPAKMPKSYYEAYIYSLNKDMQTAMRLQENRMKEV
jgi:hypothetical protein